MAKTSTQIEIPVSLKASLEGLKEVQTQVSQALDKAGKNTTLGKTLAKELSTTAAKFGEIDEILLSPTIDESGLKRLERLADQISSHFTQSFAKIDFSSFEQFATEDQLKHMRELQELTRKQRRELEAINKHGSQERTDTYLVRTDNEAALNHMRNYKGFDATQSLSKNQQAMERLSQSHERTVVSMKKQLEEYEQKADEAFNAWDAADKRVKVLEPQVATLRKDSYAATFYDKIGRMNTRISANPETVNPRISSIEKELGSALRSVEAGGVIATEARDALKDWITHTFTNVNPAEAGQMVGMTVNKLLEKLMEKIFGQGYEADREGGYDFSHSALLARGQGFADKSVKRLNAKHSTASASDLALVNQQKIKELREAKAEATTQENAAEHYMDLGMALEAQITETQQAANHTRFLAQELGRYAEAAKRAAQASKQGEINDSEQAQRDYVTQAKQEQEDNYAPSKQAYGNIKPGLDAGFEKAGNLQGAAKAAADDAEDFKKHLKQSIAHWASAQQIINVVKDGIRQAYQDIKALDSAMTNIAVVTDMSVGDLWGKINEYMSIAKQYGVTTQGVYEVSQLYYQQGLSTNEVMAATTETLKMARIAGMGYAEAADAMTVAIRAFKMNMTDAGHVTDVYSKVAAVTASDSEELAIAMSKTASSAESVGSSFENTTSMLAVMIETTRESAQNLGSALKSIISRYGEMKVGLKVDSEGEEIDYNKVDTALKSVGISIKDAQGQFRDFDDVIFELSKKWDSLDKNTQRYIATIMAGNRQQSRFIALVDNWERLEEVSTAAADSADAGLLQYAKTLDSLDTKLNTLKTNFQQFYMSIFNGEFFKGIIDIVNNIVANISNLGPILGSLNLLKLINQIKLIGQLLINSFSGALSKLRSANKEWQNNFTNGWEGVGEKIAQKIANALIGSAAETGKAYVAGVKQGAEGEQPVNNAESKSVSNFTHLTSLTQELTNPSIKATKRAKWALGLTPSGKYATNNYYTQAQAILNDPNAHAIDKKWAEKINRAYAENVAILSQNNGNQRKQLRSAQRALQLVNKANQERNEQIQLLEDENNQISKRTLSERYKAFVSKKGVQTAGRWASVAGTAASMGAMMIDTSNMQGYDEYTRLSAVGGVISAAGQALSGDIPGAILTLGMEIANTITRITNRAKVELENAKKAAEEANIKRVEKKDSYTNLNSYLQRLEELNKSRGDSIEAEAEWLALNNEVAEKYPELISYIDTEGNSIVNLTTGYAQLDGARKEAMRTNAEYWKSEMAYASQYKEMHGNTKVSSFSYNWAPETKIDDPEKKAAVVETWVRYVGYEGSKSNDTITLGKDESGSEAIFVNGALHPILTQGYQAQNIYQPVVDTDDLLNTPAEDQYFQAVDEYQNPSTNDDPYSDWVLKGYMPENTSTMAYLRDFFTKERTVKDFADQGINLSEIASSALQGDKTAQQIGSALGLFNIKDNQIVYTAIGKQILEYQDAERNYYEKARTSISSTGSLWLQTASQTENLSDLAQVEQLLLIDAIDKAGKNWTNLTSINIEKYFSEGADGILEFWSTATQSEKDTINDIITNIGSYTTPEIEKILNDYGLEAGTVLYDSILKMSESAYVPAIERMSHIYNIEIPSFSEFAALPDYQGLSKEEVTQKYIEAYKTQIKDNTSIPDFLLDDEGNFELSTNDVNSYFDSSIELNKRLKDEDNVLHKRFQNQRDLIEAGYELLASGTLEDDAEIELRELLTADDFGSRDWSKRVQEWNAKWGTTYEKIIDESTNIITESFFIYVDGVLDKVDSTLDSFEDIAEKHSKGFTFEEARDLLKRYQQLDGHANATFDEVFDILEDGTIVLNDLSLVTSEFYAQQARDMEKASKDAEDSIKQIGEHIGADDKDAIVFTKDTDKNTLTEQLLAAGIDPTMIDSIIAGIADGTIQTWNDVIAFLTRTKEEIDAGVEYYNKQTYQAKFNNWKNTKYNKAQDINFDLIGATWAEEYQKTGGDPEDTDAFNQFMEGKLSQIEGAFIDASGNLIITDANAFIKYLNSTGLVDESTLQIYTAQIEDAAIETVASIFDLIAKAIEGTLTASELVSLGEKLVNSGRMSAEEWSQFAQANIAKVGTGYKMNEAAAFALQVNTGNYDFEGLVDQFDSIEEVNEMLEELSENSKQFGDEFVEAAKRVLESIKMIKAQDPGDAMFNWMDQDMEGWAGTYESTMGSIDKANEVINASMESGTMGLNDFYNMSQIVASQLKGDELTAWNNYRDAVYATATTVDGGTVSLTNSHMTMEEALGQMTKSTESYYQDIARQQIDFIDKQIAALEAQKKVEEALTGKDINKDGTVSTGLTRDELILSADDYYDYDDPKKRRLKENGIGIYDEDEYRSAEIEWLTQRPQYVGGEEQDDYNTRESFAETVSKYMGEATQDALKAGLDITDAQVQQQIKDSAMARAGISGYYDTLTDENLAVLTTISGDVAAIREEVVQEAPSTTEPNPEGTGTVDNGSGSGNDTNNLVGPSIQTNESGVEEHALVESQQQTEHQVNIDANTDATVTTLETTNSLLEQTTGNTEKKADTPGSGKDGTTGSGEGETTTTETTTTETEPPRAANLSQEIANQIERHRLYRDVYREAGLELDYLHVHDYIKAYQMYMQARGTPVESAPVYSDQQLLELPSELEYRYIALSDALQNFGLFPEGLDQATFKQEAQQLIHYGSLGFDEGHPFAKYKFGPGDYQKTVVWESHLNTQSLNNRLSDEEILAIMQQQGPERRWHHFAKLRDDEYRTLEAAYSVGELSDEDWQLVQKWRENSQYYALKENEYYAEQEAQEAQRLAQEEYSRIYRDKHVNYESFVDVTTPPPLTDEAIRNALYWMDVREGKYDNWTEETPDITTPKKPTAMAPENYTAVLPTTTAEDLAQDLQQAGDRVVQGFEQLLAGGAEAWSRFIGEEPTLSEASLEVKTIADATLSALDNL